MAPNRNIVSFAPRNRRNSTSSDEDVSDASTTPVTTRKRWNASEVLGDDVAVNAEEIYEQSDDDDNDTTRKIPDSIAPGDRETLKGFRDFHKNQLLCSAYTGFENVADLRLFVLSYHFLEFHLHHRPWVSTMGASRVTKAEVFAIIRDSFLEPGSDKSRFPFSLEDGPAPQEKTVSGRNVPSKKGKYRKKRRADAKESIANLLITMVENLDAQPESLVDPSLQEQRWAELIAVHPYIEETPNVRNKTVKFPRLKTDYMESDLEPYNRSYCLLKYANRCFEETMWRKGARLIPRSASNEVLKVHTPVWMRRNGLVEDSEDRIVDDDHQQEDEEIVQNDRGVTTPVTEPKRAVNLDGTTRITAGVEPHKRVPAIKQEPVNDVIDLTESPEPEERPMKQEPPDDSFRPDESSNTQEREGDEGVRAKKRRREDEEEADGDDEDLQSQLEETKLQLRIIQLERRLAAQKKAKKS
ncbi:hypothetical protein PRZ48_003809 [Zasmidium cellare]|uniref:Uncharacterized protein n=1 Tax=Zasmidium cellare TaxID=395010 RepID=A0ABR0EWX2_ZASCE|nr:hypothetical protein PRZ48_003809 [Zasmidium cellare]